MNEILSNNTAYQNWLTDLKQRIRAAQQRAALAVNRELVLLYWQIGRDILDKQTQQGWGSKVVDQLAHDLRAAFPDAKGFSVRSLKYMRRFAEAWPNVQFVQEVIAQIPWEIGRCRLTSRLYGTRRLPPRERGRDLQRSIPSTHTK